MSPFRHHCLCFRLTRALCAVTAALMPAQFASAVFVDTIAPVLTVPIDLTVTANNALPIPNPVYEQPVYVFNLQTSGGVSGIVTNATIDVTDLDSGDTHWIPTGKMGPFAPGTHTVTWRATDLGLNSDTETQSVTVLPHANVAADQTVGEGGTVTIIVHLNGSAPAGGVSIPYTVSGTATSGVDYTAIGGDCTLLTGTLTIAAGTNNASCHFNVVSDGAGDSGETIIFTMETVAANLAAANGGKKVVIPGARSIHTVTLTETNLPPVAELSASQGSVTRTIVATAAAGNVTITSTVRDPNLGNTFSYDWSSSDASLIGAATNGTTNNTFGFNPVGLTPGFYTAKLTVTDNLGASSRRDLTLSVVAAAPTLSTSADTDDDDDKDNSDGYDDSDNDGIADYYDAISASHLLQGVDLMTYVSGLTDSRNNISGTFNINWTITTAASNQVFYPLLLRTTPGLKLQLGPLAIRQGAKQARISGANAISALGVNPGAGLISADGSIVDVEIDGLSPGAAAQLAIPQPAPIPAATGSPATPNFKLFTASNTWNDFSVTGNDTLKSAAKNSSSFYCPPPAHADYNTAGIAVGKECVELTITDGGSNDSDGIVNGSVRVLGAVFISTSDTTTTTTPITTPGDISASNVQNYKNNAGEGGGGIGALWWEILLLVPLLRQNTQRKGAV